MADTPNVPADLLRRALKNHDIITAALRSGLGGRERWWRKRPSLRRSTARAT